jgi:orotate phosphoribosyltransferase
LRKDMNREELAKAIKDAAYLEGDFVLSSGKRSNYYLDKWRFETDPRLLREIARALAGLLPSPKPHRVAGVELGGVPLATALSLETGIPMLVVRREAKEYGTAQGIEGVFEPGEHVVLVEDVLTTAGQAIAAARRLTEAGLEVVRIIYIIDREEGADANIREAGFRPYPLFRKSDLGIS